MWIKEGKKIVYIISLILSLTYLFNYTSAYNYEYVNVSTRVNISSPYPGVDNVVISQDILLSAGTTQVVQCNVSVHDWNGYSDIVNVNATLWDNSTVNYTSPDNNSFHYFNSSCANVSQSGYYANYTCSFDVWYYANNGTNWVCNASVIDTTNNIDDLFNTTSIQPYFALNVTPLIDYGNMVLADYSPNISANISNIGNLMINVSVYGYGGSVNSSGAGYAMLCQFGNITIANARFSSNPSDDWSSKTPLSNSPQNISGLSIPKTNVSQPYYNTTYWQLYTDPTNNPFGICNGTVVFTATAG